LRWHWLKALPAATSIVSCGPRSSSDAKSTAYETDIVEPLVISGRWTFSAAVADDSTSSAMNSNGCSNFAWGTDTTSSPMLTAITLATKTRAATGSCFIGMIELVHTRADRDPVLAPVFSQQRPQHLIEVFAALPDRAPQDAFLHRAQFPQCAIGPA